MPLKALKNTDLRPLADRARTHSQDADEVWIATAFASQTAVLDLVGTAVESGASVRFLTGTFGHVTRLRTFKALARFARSADLKARVWPGDFHAKLLLWRKGTRGIAWVGSANMTDRGLQQPGELMAEARGAWNDSTFRALRSAFDQEWNRANPLDNAFLRGYRESPRVGHLIGSTKRKTPVPRIKAGRGVSRGRGVMLVLPVTFHYSERSATLKRVTARLGGADVWYRSSNRHVRAMKEGKFALLADAIYNTVSVVVATDQIRDGKPWVFSHRPFTRLADPKMGVRLRQDLSQLGLSPTKRAFRTQWLDRDTAAQIVERLYGKPARRRFESSLD